MSAVSLLRASSVVSVMTMISRISGLARDVVMTSIFGAGGVMDAWLIAFRIPNFTRRLFAEGAFSQAFVPVLAEYKQQRPLSEVQTFLRYVLGNLSLILGLVALLCVLFPSTVVWLFANGWDKESERYQLAVSLLRITSPYLAFVSLAAMAGAILNTYHRFAIPAFTPVVLNLCMIVGAVMSGYFFKVPISALAWAVLIAGVLQYAMQWPYLAREKLFVMPRIGWREPGVRRVVSLMGPAIFGVSVAQVNFIVDNFFASYLAVGSITWLYMADRLMNFPLGVFGVAIATAILPHLSLNNAASSDTQYQQNLDWGVRMVLLISVPAMVGLLLLAGPIAICVFRHGNVTDTAALMAGSALVGFSVGLPSFMLIKVLAAGFYAKSNIKTPVRIGIIAMVLNLVFIALLIGPLKHVGLALATSLSGWVNAGLLFYTLKRRGIYKPQANWPYFMWQLSLAIGAVLAWLLLLNQPMSVWLIHSTLWRLGYLALLVVPSMLIYVGVLKISGLTWQQLRR